MLQSRIHSGYNRLSWMTLSPDMRYLFTVVAYAGNGAESYVS
jgi:hypothetical protein